MQVETVGTGTPDVAVVGALHGDEPCGARAIQRFLAEDHDVRRPAKLIVANERALSRDVRYVETDLNRAIPGDPESELYEERLASELMQEIEGCTALGIHSTVSYPEAFASVADATAADHEIVSRLPVSKAADFSAVADGRCVELPGFVDVEAGLQRTERAAENAYDCIVRFFRALGVLPGEAPATETTHYEVFETVEKERGRPYRFRGENFERVPEGTVFAESGDRELRADREFWPVLMSDDGHSTLLGYKSTLTGPLADAEP